jgi:hypothetical protein
VYFLSKEDYATIFISAAENNNMLGNDACRIKVSYDGMRASDLYNGGWTNANLGVTVKSAYRGSISGNSDKDYGYIVELAIPRSKLKIKSGQLLLNFSITDKEGGGDAIFDTFSTSTAKWILVTGL